MANIYDRKSDRLQTTDEHGRRVYVHPEDLKGQWRTYRLSFYWLLIGIYLILPWINIHGKQSVLIDIPGREFIVFGARFLGHDTPYLFFFLLGFAFFIAMVTAIFGRVWCGWACPQTVFIETLYRKVEMLIEGNARRRRALEEAPWNAEKILKRTLKWTCYLIISLHITHSTLGYFVGARELFWITTKAPAENWSLFITMLVINGIILFDFGWFREQFCIIMCPYGRMQSVLMDSNSLVVAYDYNRGEPRKGEVADASKEKQGDCVNCYQCVKVCPTGIDIRKGLQLECIACTACIDACDNIMDKLKKPRGLIRYTTENSLEGNKSKLFSARRIAYGVVLIAIIIVSSIVLSHKNDMRAVLVRGSRDTFKIIEQSDKKDPTILNHFRVEIYYQSETTTNIYFKVSKSLEERGVKIVTPMIPFKHKGKRKQVANVFFKFPKSLLKDGSFPAKLYFYEGNQRLKENLLLKKDVPLVGPYK